MRYKIEYTSLYLRKARKFLKNNPSFREAYKEFLLRLTTDPFEPSLHTHCLSGELKGKYSCTVTYKLRVIFEIIDKTILLLNIGSHDEVY